MQKEFCYSARLVYISVFGLGGNFVICRDFISLKGLLFALFASFLVTLLVHPLIPRGIAVALLFTGLLGMLLRRWHLFKGLSNEEKCLIFVFALFSMVSLASFLWFPYSRMSHYRIEDYLSFLLVLPLFLLLREYRFNVKSITTVFSSVAIFLGCISLLQLWSMQTGNGVILTFDNRMAQSFNRPSGAVNPMRYAAISLIFVGFALNAMLFIRNKPLWYKSLLALAVIMAGVACMLTQVRGSWVALLALLGVYLLVLFLKGHKKFMGIFVSCCIFSLLVVSQLEHVEHRIERTEQSLERYLDGDSNSSLGARLDMFKAAWWLIQERPWFGHGLNSYSEKATEIRNNTPGMNREVGMWHNPHNEILQSMVEKGVLGLITLLLVFAVPGWLFLRVFRDHGDNCELSFLSFSGLDILVVYFFAGLSVALFEHDVFNHFFVITIVFLASQVHSHSVVLGAGGDVRE